MSMIESIRNRKTYENYMISLIFFIICFTFQLMAILFHLILITIIGMFLYVIFSIGVNKKEHWHEIYLKKIEKKRYLPLILLIILSITILFYIIQYFLVGYTNLNFFLTIAQSQQQYGVVTTENKWMYFPIAVVGFGTLPLFEDLFFRGPVIKSFEIKVDPSIANLIQSSMFALIHVTYFLTIEINYFILLPMLIWVFIEGFFYGFITQMTRSLYSAIIVHVINDIFLMAIVYIFII